jgi:hypothetical protein
LDQTYINFDYKFYIETYPDLIKNGNIHTQEAAILHYFMFGQNEARITNKDGHRVLIPCDFDWITYSHLNPELNITHMAEALLHYINFGIEECRAYKKQKYYSSIHMMFKDEESILKEWLDYYLIIGIDHFYLYDHNSTDDSVNIIKPYVEKGLITLKQHKGSFNELHSLMNETLKTVRGETKWLAFFDSDEFLVLKTCDNIKDFLIQYEYAGGIAVNWQMFGTSNVESIPKDKTLIETLTMKLKKDHNENHVFKSIIQPLKTNKWHNQHVASFINNFYLVDETHTMQPFNFWPLKTVTINKIQLNHYFTRTTNFFTTKALRRKNLMNEDLASTLNRYNTYNEVIDTSISKYTDKLRKRLLFDKTTKTDIISHLIDRKKYISYLEIGTNKKIIHEDNKKYDIILIDSAHEKHQTDKDTYNSLLSLNKGGTIIIHNCNPLTTQSNNTSYQTIIELRTAQPCLSVYVVDTDGGCAIVHEGSQKLHPQNAEVFTYKYFDKHRKELLNIISVDDFYKLYP